MGKLRDSIKTYRRLLRATRKYWFIFVLGLFGTVMLSLADASLTWSIKPLLDKGFVRHEAFFLEMLPFFVLVIFIFRGIAGFMSNYFISRVARKVVMDFRRHIFHKFLHIPAPFYDKNSSGHLLAAIIYNVEQLAQATSDTLITFLQESSLVIGLVVVMFISSWQLATMFVLTAPFVAMVVKWSSNSLRKLSHNVQQSVGDVTHVADECIQGYKVIRLYGGQAYEYEKFMQVTKKNQRRELKIVITNSIGTAVVQFLVAIPIAVTVLFAVAASIHVTAGSFSAVIASMIMLLRPVRRLTTLNTQIQKGIAGADSIFAILDEPAERDMGTLSISRAAGRIEFCNVEFSYTSSAELVLKRVNFKVEPEQTVAIVGRSGAGKSTLVNLLPRFYEIQRGEIKIDDINICDYQLNDLRHQFAVVTQNTVLFNDTIANNIAYGIQDKVTRAEIVAAAEAAHAMEFIQHLVDGLETRVGENGIMLSGGQRQRIAIARALLKNAPILILDEATSALDTHSEWHIQQALENLMQKRTTLVIAHRLSTIEKADRIIVLDKGQIVEEGSHRQLLEKNGAYATLHHMQFKEPVELQVQTV